MVFIGTLEKCLSKSLNREVVFDKVFEPIKPGDVPDSLCLNGTSAKSCGIQAENFD